MKTKLLLFTLLLSSLSYAQVTQGFENVTGITFNGAECRYFDGDNTTVHELDNTNPVCGTIIVKEASSGNALGYSIVLDPTTPNGPAGFSDGDAFGVASAAFLTSEVSFVAPEGSQAFFMEDTDGTITMTFDAVDLAGTTNPQFSMQYQLEDTSYEAADFIRITIVTSGCGTATTLTLIDTSGLDIDDDFSIEDAWITLNADLTPYVGCSAQLVVEFSSNSAAEEFAIDDISFSAGMTLSNENFSLDTSIGVSPNPSNGNITIKNSGVALNTVAVTDMNGRAVATYNLNGITTDKNLDMSSVLSSGLYFMTISSNETSVVKKIIIK